LDSINNVENVFLTDSSGSNYVIYVIGRDVNVNAVTAQTNTYAININPSGAFAPNVVQDFALVVSCGEGEVPNAMTVVNNGIVSNPTGDQQITYVTSTNTTLLNQIVGASSPLLGTNTISVGTNSEWNPNGAITLGMTNQWHFYVVTNTLGYTNAAFVTFSPNTLSIPRMGVFANSDANSTRPEADIDLYVAGPNDPNASSLTNLDPNVISNCVNGLLGDGASLTSGGTEFVAYNNSVSNNVYYIGVKSEDQMAAEYDFLPVFSLLPFSQTDKNGIEIINGVPLPASIPDGNNAHPGVVFVLALALDPTIVVGNVVVTNYTVDSDNYGDIVGTLTHPGSSGLAVLNNHDSPDPSGINATNYDDSGQSPNAQPSDGPGSLLSFAGQQAIGAWFLTEVDDAPSQGAAVTSFQLFIQPHQPLQNGTTNTIPPHSWFYDYVDVPAGATNLTIAATNVSTAAEGGADLFNPPLMVIKFGSEPTLTNADKGPVALVYGTPPGNSLSVGPTDVPPIQPGRYWVGITNQSNNPQDVYVIATILPVNPFGTPVDFSSSGAVPLLDDAVTVSSNSSIRISTNLPIVSVNVGIRVDHPRISDLVFHLISPDGTRILLMENRGGDTTNGAGATIVVTNIFSGTATGGPAAQTNFYNLGETAGTVPITYDMFTIPDQMTVYYSTNATPANLITNFFTSYNGTINISFPPTGVPATSTYLTVVMNETNHPASTAWTYTIGGVQTNYLYLMFTDDTNLTTTPIKYAVPPFVPNTAFSNAWSDSFETYPTGIYSPTKPFGGWTVRTNQVAIVTNPPAYTGTNSLSLMDGAVSYTLPTVAGQKYTLQYAQGRLPFTGLIVANAKQAEPVDIGQVSKFDLNGNGSIYNNTLIFPYSVAFDNNGNLYVADDSDNTIYKFTPPGANGVVFATAASGLYQPQGLACDSSGNLYVANEGNGTIYKFTPGGVGTFFANAGSGNISSPDALAFDGSGNLYVANYDDDSVNDGSGYGTIEEFKNANPNSAFYFATFTNGLENPVGLTFDNTGTNLYVANDNAFGIVGNTILEFSPPSTNVTVIATLNQPTALAFDNNGNLYVTDIGTQAIYKIANGAPVAGTPPIFAANDANNYLNSPEGLAFYTSNSEETNSANWQPPGLSTFTASQPNMPLVLDASGGGFVANSDSVVTNVFSDITLFDEFSLTAVPTDLYYQPEQSLSALAGTSPEGNWQLEIQDDRTGATNNTALVSWELQFILDNTNALPGTLFGGAGQTNFIGAGGIAWYQVTVPAVANYATNRLKFSSAPVNVWFDTNSPPTTNILFLPDITYPSGTNGSVLLSTAGASPLEPSPNIVPDETYYLGVQNTNSFTINYAVEVDFDAGNVKTPDHLMFTSAVRKASGIGLQWTAALGAQVEVQWSDALTSPMQWNTITNPAATTSNGVSTFTDNGSQSAPLGAHRFYRLVQLPPAPHQLHR
jgi:subtilisin-like proprotein convertase family protein/sugar lactone lactonase YvrE